MYSESPCRLATECACMVVHRLVAVEASFPALAARAVTAATAAVLRLCGGYVRAELQALRAAQQALSVS